MCVSTKGTQQGWQSSKCLQVQYADGDKEQGITFIKYEVQQDSNGAQLIKVFDYKPGTYMVQEAETAGSHAAASAGDGNDAPVQKLLMSAAGDDGLFVDEKHEGPPGEHEVLGKTPTCTTDNVGIADVHSMTPC